MFKSKRKRIKELEQDVERFKFFNEKQAKEIGELSFDKENLQGLVNSLNSRAQELEKQNSSLLTSQQTALEWIEKILHEVGIQELKSYTPSVTIPVYKRSTAAYDNVVPFDKGGDFIPKEEITIPQIRFLRMGR